MTNREIDFAIHRQVMGLPAIDPPNYSENIQSAWLVVEKMVDQFGYTVTMDRNLDHPAEVELWIKDEEISETTIQWYRVHADTMPLAICRASLLAIGDRKDGN